MFFHRFAQAGIWFQLATFFYLIAIFFLMIGLIRKEQRLTRAGLFSFFFAFVMNTAVILDQWMAAGRAPFKTLYETMLFYPWCVAFVFILMYSIYRLTILGVFASFACVMGFVYACLNPDVEIIQLPPALQSAWFVPHVVTYFIAYASLFSSFSLAVLYLIFPLWRKGESGIGFEYSSNQSLNFGFVALTFGLVMGSIWGKLAWGDYWTWDPKENWALATWLIYLVAIHLRFIKGWKGKKAAVISILGFAAVIFTYLGMSLLPTSAGSLHVYQ